MAGGSVGRHNKRTGRLDKVVVRRNGEVIATWQEPALGPVGRRGSLEVRDNKGGREAHVSQGTVYSVGQIASS